MLIVSYEYINTDGNVHKRTVTFTNEELFKKWVTKEERKYINGIWKIEDPADEVYTAEELERRVGNAYMDGRGDAIDEFIRRDYACKNGSISCCHLEDDMDCTECIVKQMKEAENE